MNNFKFGETVHYWCQDDLVNNEIVSVNEGICELAGGAISPGPLYKRKPQAIEARIKDIEDELIELRQLLTELNLE